MGVQNLLLISAIIILKKKQNFPKASFKIESLVFSVLFITNCEHDLSNMKYADKIS